MVRALLRTRVRLAWNAVVRGNPFWTFVIVIVVGLSVVTFVAGGLAFRALARDQPGLLDGALAAFVAGSILLTGLFTLPSVVHALYLAPDLELLLSAPVPTPALFAVKVAEIVLQGGSLGLLIGLSAVSSYGIAVGAPPLFFVATFIVVPALSVVGACAAVLMVGAVARVVPTSRLRGAMTVLGGVFPATFYLALQFWRPRGAFDPQGVERVLERTRSVTARGPIGWAVTVLTGIRDGDVVEVATGLVPLAALAAVVVGGAYVFFRWTFYVTWGAMSGAEPHRRRGAGFHWEPRIVPRHLWSLALKDWRTIRRDARTAAGLAMPVVMSGVFAFQMSSRGIGRVPPDAAFPASLVLVLIVVFLIGPEFSRLAFGAEGLNVQLLRTVPMRARDIVVAKFLTGFVPLTGLILLLVTILAIWRRASPALAVAAALAATWIGAGVVTSSVAGSSIATDFSADGPHGGGGGCLGSLISFSSGSAFAASGAGVFAWLTMRNIDVVPSVLRSPAVATVLLVVHVAACAVIAALVLAGIRRLEGVEVN